MDTQTPRIYTSDTLFPNTPLFRSLTAAGIERRAESVRRVGGGRCRDPDLTKDAVADGEVGPPLEAHICGRQRKGVMVERTEHGRGAGGTQLVGFRLREIGRRPRHSRDACALGGSVRARCRQHRSEEHTSELQSLMRISYAVFCLKKKKT